MKTVLLLAQRPSDYVEMKRAAQFLKTQNQKCILLLDSVCDKSNQSIISELTNSDIKNTICDVFLRVSLDRQIVMNNLDKNENMNKKKCKVKENNEMGKKITKILPIFFKKLLDPGIKSVHEVIKLYATVMIFLKNCFGYIKIKVKNFLMKVFGYEILSFLYIYKIYIKKYFLFKKIIKRHAVDLIILPEDIVGSTTAVLIKAGHFYNVPSVIVPYTIANQEEAFQSLKSNSQYFSAASLLNRIVGLFFKSWVMKKDGYSLVRLPGQYALSQILLGISPQDPWMMNSGKVDKIIIENDEMYEYYIRARLERNKLVKLGAFYDDVLHNHLANRECNKQKLLETLGIDVSRPILLIGGCPNQIISNPPGFDFQSMEQMIEFIITNLKTLDAKYHICVRPHPNYIEFGDFFTKYGFSVLHSDTANLIALSDIYIAFASATIRWAISCGVPTINYDVFHYDFSDYKNVSGVLHVKTKDEFKQAITTMDDEMHFKRIKSKLKTEKIRWGNLDGKSGERILNFIHDLSEKRVSKVTRRQAYA